MADPALEQHTRMHAEWVAWRLVCHELKCIGIDVNEAGHMPLAAAIEAWGEELVELRSHQEPDVVQRAYHDKVTRYEGLQSPGFTVES